MVPSGFVDGDEIDVDAGCGEGLNAVELLVAAFTDAVVVGLDVVVAWLELLIKLELMVELTIKELPLSIGPINHVRSSRCNFAAGYMLTAVCVSIIYRRINIRCGQTRLFGAISNTISKGRTLA